MKKKTIRKIENEQDESKIKTKSKLTKKKWKNKTKIAKENNQKIKLKKRNHMPVLGHRTRGRKIFT